MPVLLLVLLSLEEVDVHVVPGSGRRCTGERREGKGVCKTLVAIPP